MMDNRVHLTSEKRVQVVNLNPNRSIETAGFNSVSSLLSAQLANFNGVRLYPKVATV